MVMLSDARETANQLSRRYNQNHYMCGLPSRYCIYDCRPRVKAVDRVITINDTSELAVDRIMAVDRCGGRWTRSTADYYVYCIRLLSRFTAQVVLFVLYTVIIVILLQVVHV